MYKKIALESYKKFSQLEGNRHIASEGALRNVLKYLKYNNSKQVLEIGTGIGCIAYAILQGIREGYLAKNLFYYGTEANDFCIQQIEKNIGHPQNFLYFPQLNDVPKFIKFDFIIVDGRDDALKTALPRLNNHGIIFIEGGRKSQLNFIMANNAEHRRFLAFREIFLRKRPYGPFYNREVGGGAIMIFEPRATDYFLYLTRKAATAFKYRVLRRLTAV